MYVLSIAWFADVCELIPKWNYSNKLKRNMRRTWMMPCVKIVWQTCNVLSQAVINRYDCERTTKCWAIMPCEFPPFISSSHTTNGYPPRFDVNLSGSSDEKGYALCSNNRWRQAHCKIPTADSHFPAVKKFWNLQESAYQLSGFTRCHITASSTVCFYTMELSMIQNNLITNKQLQHV